MPTRPNRNRPGGAATPQQVDQRRGSARERGYDRQWDKASARHKAEHPLCRYCEAGVFGPKRVTAVEVTDHLYPHNGDREIFWADQWWVSSCTPCHSGPKQALEHQGLAALHALAARLGLPAKETPSWPERSNKSEPLT